MRGRRVTVRLTDNFERNLAAIESFLASADATPRAFTALLNELAETVIPNLERHLGMGRPFLARQARSVEARARLARLKARIGKGEMREYLVGDYLILYAVMRAGVYLLAIKHQRQLSFDFGSIWISS